MSTTERHFRHNTQYIAYFHAEYGNFAITLPKYQEFPVLSCQIFVLFLIKLNADLANLRNFTIRGIITEPPCHSKHAELIDKIQNQ